MHRFVLHTAFTAAVLTLASREAAEWFPDIKGFRTFRVPLARKARL